MIRFISKNNRWLLVSHLSFFPSFFLVCFFLSSLVLHPIALRYDQRSYVGLCVQWNLDIINEPLHNEFLCLTNDILATEIVQFLLMNLERTLKTPQYYCSENIG